jgi:cytochrome c2
VKLPKGKYEFIGTAGAYVTEKGNLTVTATAKATPKTTVPAASTGKSTKPSGSATGSSSPGSSTGTPGATTTPAGGATAPAANNVGDPVAGAGLFQQAGCGGCHTLKAAGATGTVGPNLDQVAPDENTVITNVTFGNAMGMPAFSPQFSTTQIQNIAAYVYQSTH